MRFDFTQALFSSAAIFGIWKVWVAINQKVCDATIHLLWALFIQEDEKERIRQIREEDEEEERIIRQIREEGLDEEDKDTLKLVELIMLICDADCKKVIEAYKRMKKELPPDDEEKKAD